MLEKLDQLEMILEVLFCHYSAQLVLQHYDEPVGIPREEYIKLAYSDVSPKRGHSFSKEELGNQFLYFRHQANQESERSEDDPFQVALLDPMKCLFYYVQKMLHREKNEIVCRYQRLLDWRYLTQRIGVDLPAAAFLGIEKKPEELNPSDLNWKMALDHDNFQLQRIMQRGISENHFHLYGSAPIFHLSWISLMNRLTSSNAAARLRQYDRAHNSPQTRVDTTLFEPPMRMQHLQAAAIRLILFFAITLKEHPAFGSAIPTGSDDSEEVQTACDGDEGQDGAEVCCRARLTRDEAWRRRINRRLHRLIVLLKSSANAEDGLLVLEDLLNDLQNTIDTLRDWNDTSLPDYMLLVCPGNLRQDDDSIFVGERWLLYQCLHRIYHGLISTEYVNLFYAYLILKERLRHELIQIDEGVGFSRFQDYERRKFDLLEDSILKDKTGAAARAAVRRELFQNPNICSLEIRLSPFDTAEENADRLRKLDEILCGPQERFFYVLHFIKRPDNWRESDKDAFYCRHYLFRRKLLRQIRAIQYLRERYPGRATRVLGIDAASTEIGCRPEVFGPGFRFLHVHSATLEKSDGIHPLPQLRRTYHVGEDFLDVADGLRAIDEAIHFLGLESGDRLGHAMALGIDVQAWYAAKNYVITLPMQDYLDNVAWLYHRLLKYKLKETPDVLEYLKCEFNRFFGIIYKRHMSAEDLRQLDLDIDQYFRAWKLRGDDPEFYNDGKYEPPDSDDPYDKCRVNQKYPKEPGIRDDPGANLIYYYYHYSKDVRIEGEQQIQKKVQQIFVDAVAKVQRAMQREISGLGLGIECNPTSNVYIGTFKRYDKHPILRFYNRELEVDSDLLEENPQMMVSINTDDMGIFSTSLENEYALMACALEKAEKPDGSRRYPRQRVYAWLDDVRQMGIEQSFDRDGAHHSGPTGRRFRITAGRRRRT